DIVLARCSIGRNGKVSVACHEAQSPCLELSIDCVDDPFVDERIRKFRPFDPHEGFVIVKLGSAIVIHSYVMSDCDACRQHQCAKQKRLQRSHMFGFSPSAYSCNTASKRE